MSRLNIGDATSTTTKDSFDRWLKSWAYEIGEEILTPDGKGIVRDRINDILDRPYPVKYYFVAVGGKIDYVKYQYTSYSLYALNYNPDGTRKKI